MPTSAETLQRDYYAQTADSYDSLHLEGAEHQFAVSLLGGVIRHLNAGSLLDVGSGTGRVPRALSGDYPDVRFVGIEPSEELRRVGHRSGVPRAMLIDGDARSLPYADGEFDIVTAFGALHHIPEPRRAVAEMIRVARRAVFISDANNFGQGSAVARACKQALRRLGLWRLADLVKTGGKGYTISEGDGLAYSYSVFDDYSALRRACRVVHLMNSRPSGPDLYRTAGHLVVIGMK